MRLWALHWALGYSSPTLPSKGFSFLLQMTFVATFYHVCSCLPSHPNLAMPQE